MAWGILLSARRFCGVFLMAFFCAGVLLSGTASAQVERWAEEGYDFKKVKRLLVYDMDCSKANLGTDITEKNFVSVFWEQTMAQKIEVLNLQKVENKVSLLEYEDIDQLRKTDPGAAEAMWNRVMPQVVDAWAKTQYLKHDYTSRVIPAHTEWRTHYRNRVWYDRDGKKHEESVPEVYPEFVPERTVVTLHQQVRLDVYDAKTGKCIYSRNEVRSDDDVGDGKDIFEKIIRNTFKDFVKKTE